MKTVSEDFPLKITLGALLAVLVGIFGFAVWMTTMQANASSSADKISDLQGQATDVQKSLQSIDKRLGRIEILLERKK